MTTRRNKSEQYRDRIRPFLDEWEERGLNPWEQFRNWSVQQILWDAALSTDQVEDITRVDGKGDEGIDAWYVDDSASPQRLVLVQSKVGQIAREDFSKMKDALLNLLGRDRPTNANRALLEKASLFNHDLPDEFEVDLYLSSSMIAQQNLTPNPNGEPWQSDEMLIPGINRKIRIYSYVRDIKFLVKNRQLMHEDPVIADFIVEKTALFEYSVGGHTKTVAAALSAVDLANLYQKEKQNLFRRNPRYYLGLTGPRNKAIGDTLKDTQNEDFYIYNNGLTCVAKSIRVDELGSDPTKVRITAEDFQIVNGCQTTATIADVGLRENLKKVRVLAKIIENPHSGSEESDVISDNIAVYSNSQNPLKAEDWKANDPRQRGWHQEFLQGVPEPWFYEIKRGTWGTSYRDANSRKPFRDKVTAKLRKVTMKDLGQSCWAFLGYPAEAKDKPREIFNNINNYDKVFNQTLTATQLLLPHLIYVAADAKTKVEPTYTLPSSDREYEQFHDARISTDHLRHSIVAAVGNIFFSLKGSAPGYLSHDESAHLISNSTEWLERLVDDAFSTLARRLLLESVKSGIGPRSIVRKNDWMNDTNYYLADSYKRQVKFERDAGSLPGTLAHSLPFTTV